MEHGIKGTNQTFPFLQLSSVKPLIPKKIKVLSLILTF